MKLDQQLQRSSKFNEGFHGDLILHLSYSISLYDIGKCFKHCDYLMFAADPKLFRCTETEKQKMFYIMFFKGNKKYHTFYNLQNKRLTLVNIKYHDLSFIFKLLNTIIRCPKLLELVNIVPSRLFRNNDLLFTPMHVTNYDLHNPINRTLKWPMNE